MIKVSVHTILHLRKIIGKGEVEIVLPNQGTLMDLLKALVSNWGDELGSCLFDSESSEPLSYIRFMINGRDISFLDGMKTELQQGDDVLILPPVGGG